MSNRKRIGAALAIGCAIPAVWWLATWALSSCRPYHLGILHNAGDAFAPVAGALSAATLYLVVESIRMQRSELSLQRKELRLQRQALQQQVKEFKLSRAELAGQAASLAEQARILREQLTGMEAQRLTMVDANSVQRQANRLASTRLALDLDRELFVAKKELLEMRRTMKNGLIAGLKHHAEAPEFVSAFERGVHVQLSGLLLKIGGVLARLQIDTDRTLIDVLALTNLANTVEALERARGEIGERIASSTREPREG